MSNAYEDIKEQAFGFNENLDCAVKAVAIVFQLSYSETHAMFKKAGRKNRSGTSRSITESIVATLCVDRNLKPIKSSPKQIRFNKSRGCEDVHKYTPKSIHRHFPSGRQLIFVRGHVFAMIFGKVYDWTEGRRHHILEAWDIQDAS